MSERDESLPELMTVNEIAEGLRSSTKTVWRLIASGDLKSVRIGRLVRIMKCDYAAYVKLNRR